MFAVMAKCSLIHIYILTETGFAVWLWCTFPTLLFLALLHHRQYEMWMDKQRVCGLSPFGPDIEVCAYHFFCTVCRVPQVAMLFIEETEFFMQVGKVLQERFLL